MDQAIKDGTYPGKEAEILKAKTNILNALHKIKERYFTKNVDQLTSNPEYFYQNIIQTEDIIGINIRRSNGSVS